MIRCGCTSSHPTKAVSLATAAHDASGFRDFLFPAQSIAAETADKINLVPSYPGLPSINGRSLDFCFFLRSFLLRASLKATSKVMGLK